MSKISLVYFRMGQGNLLREGRVLMKRIATLFAITLLASGLCFAGTVVGYISDEGCARNGEARNPECAKNCIQSGATAVLVTSDGTIYSIREQDKVKKFAGEMIAVTGKIEGEAITAVEKAELCAGSGPCKS